MKSSKITFISVILFLSAVQSIRTAEAAAQSHISTQPHQDAVSAIIPAGIQSGTAGTPVFSAGRDGFLIKWTDDGLGEHYQISDIPVTMAACSPDGQTLAAYETDGGSISRISVWDWKTLTRKYIIRFNTTVTSISFSEKGSYLIAGTASVNGALFFNVHDGSQVKKVNVNTGVITMAATSSTENSAVMYSPSGSLTYYNLRTGDMQTRFATEDNLTQPLLFNNNLFLAGIKNNTLLIIQATTGKTLISVTSQSPLLLSSKTDSDLYYLSFDGRTYTVNVIRNVNNILSDKPETVKSFSRLPGRETVISGIKDDATVILGTKQGSIYKTGTAPDTALTSLTESMYDRILDICQSGDSFYFLTKSAIFKSSYDSGAVTKIASVSNQMNITPFGSKLILWSKNTRNPIQILDTSSGQTVSLFVPENAVKVLRTSEHTILDMEGNSYIREFDTQSMKSELLYTGAGLQDMVLYNDTDLYVAKSSATRPESALICINTQTQETVPISIDGTIAYSLNFDPQNHIQEFYGILVSENNDAGKTSLFAFNPENKTYTTVMDLPNEDTDAFTILYYPNIFTNLGKNQIESINLESHKDFLYKRSASMPLKIAKSAERIAVLNRDGSISWYNTQSSAALADWYLTTDGQWFEF